MVLQFWLLALTKRVKSSTKKIWEILGPVVVILMGVQFLFSTSVLMLIESLSIQIMNIQRDMGSPCRMPLEGPFKLIKSFLQVNFQDYICHFPFHLVEVRDEFMNSDSIICSSSIRLEASLVRANNPREEGLNSIHNDLSDQFVGCVTKSNQPEVSDVGSIKAFWNQANESRYNPSDPEAFVGLKKWMARVIFEYLRGCLLHQGGGVVHRVWSPLLLISLSRDWAKSYVPPPSINGRSMEEPSVSIPLTQPIDSGFCLPKVFFHF
ncbi:hypothetical protein KY285_010007 [Solanum tuberosum]|nr:hypothetical protein KY285_010007 [Solanum tuberosum]